MTSVGVVGFGSFGKLVAETLTDRFVVRVSSRDPRKVPEKLRATFAEVCTADYLVLCMPLGGYESVLANVAKEIGPKTVVVDVCSVKVMPLQRVAKALPGNRVVATHPLFGPETVQNGLKDLVMVVCDEDSDTAEAKKVSVFAESLGLRVVHMSAEQHDRQMAKVHALTFFIARALFGTDFSGVIIKTPSFQRLMSLVDLESHHSQELFDSIQNGNPFAEEVRQRFIADITALDKEISAKDTV